LLRESRQAKGESSDLTVLIGGRGDGNIPQGDLLVAFADAVLSEDDQRLAEVHSALRTTMGDAALVDAAAVAATFNAIDRIADATGIPIEDANAESTAELRASLGLNVFAENRGEIADPRDRARLR
jgi:alkylhydroperoxidase family enzyme